MAKYYPISISEQDAARFWLRVDKSKSCWLWTGALSNGYGTFSSKGRGFRAHRVAWVLTNGRQIPDGLELDHICRVTACVNPAHLEPVTARVNVRRGISIPAINARKTHCRLGHPLEGTNLIQRAPYERVCVQCMKRRRKAMKKRQVAAGLCYQCGAKRTARSIRLCDKCCDRELRRWLKGGWEQRKARRLVGPVSVETKQQEETNDDHARVDGDTQAPLRQDLPRPATELK